MWTQCTSYVKFTACYTYPPKVLCATVLEYSVTNLMVCVPHFINETTQQYTIK